MNNDLLYTVDPYIISILFLTKSDEEALTRYNMILEDVVEVTNATMKEYLLENKFTEEEVDEVLKLDDIDKAHPKFKPYLQNIILIDRINNNVKALLKTYYDILLKTLPEDKKNELDNYLKENQKLLEERQAIIKEGLGLLKNLLEENGVETVAELERKIGPISFEENINTTLENQNPVESPSINLGGANTNPSTEPVTSPEEQPNNSSQHTNNDPEMSPIVNMALDSTINNITDQPEVINQENTQTLVEQEKVVEPANEEIKFTPMNEVPEEPQTENLPTETATIQTMPAPIQELPSINAVQTVSPMNFVNPIQQEVPAPPIPDQIEQVQPVQQMDEIQQVQPVQVEQPIQPDQTIQPVQQVEQPTPMEPIQPMQQVEPETQNVQAEPQLSAINKLDGLGISLDNPTENTQQ